MAGSICSAEVLVVPSYLLNRLSKHYANAVLLWLNTGALAINGDCGSAVVKVFAI